MTSFWYSCRSKIVSCLGVYQFFLFLIVFTWEIEMRLGLLKYS
ncbi:hypothetical protein VAE128_470081 [Vibrio aestuarianus]|nr:hypothetical protein VAE128_470081 [Vibrio aestuarianus]